MEHKSSEVMFCKPSRNGSRRSSILRAAPECSGVDYSKDKLSEVEWSIVK